MKTRVLQQSTPHCTLWYYGCTMCSALLLTKLLLTLFLMPLAEEPCCKLSCVSWYSLSRGEIHTSSRVTALPPRESYRTEMTYNITQYSVLHLCLCFSSATRRFYSIKFNVRKQECYRIKIVCRGCGLMVDCSPVTQEPGVPFHVGEESGAMLIITDREVLSVSIVIDREVLSVSIVIGVVAVVFFSAAMVDTSYIKI